MERTMKRMLLVVAMIAVASSGCSTSRSKRALAPAAVTRPAPPQLVDANGAPIEKVPFVTGVSSATVEGMAKAQACRSEEGASLVTPAGPVEVYRMRCDDGKVFMARCEMRQCKQM
jgi:hypothetical protein